ncbi:MAG: nucleotidyl transferase AbiEii/AbiGii toxin family protein [Desulfuromusa sp.]|nr:nucleotidyl transferase AbiEii/AbiGii toxin family protein [Desulfuromusa sp.]
MFERPHHQQIAQVLLTLEGSLLLEHNCLFGGGTAIALRYGEYRESVDIDLLVSDINSYRQLRLLSTDTKGIMPLFRKNSGSVSQIREVRADQYGIRTMLLVANKQIKFEIILEGRIKLQQPGEDDQICGIATLSLLDMVTSKLLANSDRWADEGVFNRDLIDLAMMQPPKALLRAAITKAEQPYGNAIIRDIEKATEKLRQQNHWLERCMLALDITIPKAVIWEKIRTLKRIMPAVQ